MKWSVESITSLKQTSLVQNQGISMMFDLCLLQTGKTKHCPKANLSGGCAAAAADTGQAGEGTPPPPSLGFLLASRWFHLAIPGYPSWRQVQIANGR